MSNPYRYRGYRFDTETGLYYLQSRYYNPEIGRLNNADDSSILKLNILGKINNNLFTYCSNNPVNSSDPTGYISMTDVGWILVDVIFTCSGFGWIKQLAYATVGLYWGIRLGMQLTEFIQARSKWLSVRLKDPRYHDSRFYQYSIGQISAIASSIFGVVSAIIPIKGVGKSVARAIAYGITSVFGPALGSISTLIGAINAKY